MRFSIRYNLQDVLAFLTLVPLSTGLVCLADLASGAALDCFRPTVDAIKDGVASMVGGLSTSGRGFLVYGINGIASGLLLSCLAALLLLLRNNWATRAAFSLPFSVLFFMFPLFWMAAVPLTTGTASALVQPTIVAAIVAACLFSFCVCCRRRLRGAKFPSNAAYSERPAWQRLLLVMAFTGYLLSCAYGWYRMASHRMAWIESRRYWEQIVP